MPTNFTTARRNMVDSQVRPNGITDSRIIDAMLVVARENFLADGQSKLAYMEGDIALSRSRALMSAMAFARLLQAAEIRPEDRVLVIGAGSGYGTAVVRHMAAEVVALESDEELLRHARVSLDGDSRIQLVQGELAAGHAARAPYNVILIEGGVGAVPDKLFAQLAEGGRLVAVVDNGRISTLKVATKTDGVVSWRRGADCAAPMLPQFLVAAPEFVF